MFQTTGVLIYWNSHIQIVILFERCWLYKTWKPNVQQVYSFSVVYGAQTEQVKKRRGHFAHWLGAFCASSALYWIVVHTELDVI